MLYIKYHKLTLLFLYFHHFPLPLIKSRDVLWIFAVHSWICVYAGSEAGVLSKITRKQKLGHLLWLTEGIIVPVVPEFLTCSFGICEVLGSRCGVL